MVKGYKHSAEIFRLNGMTLGSYSEERQAIILEALLGQSAQLHKFTREKIDHPLPELVLHGYVKDLAQTVTNSNMEMTNVTEGLTGQRDSLATVFDSVASSSSHQILDVKKDNTSFDDVQGHRGT